VRYSVDSDSEDSEPVDADVHNSDTLDVEKDDLELYDIKLDELVVDEDELVSVPPLPLCDVVSPVCSDLEESERELSDE